MYKKEQHKHFRMKEIIKNHNKKCSETDSLLSQYGFVEEYESVIRDNKTEELRFLYLQLKPTIGLLVYNFYHTDTKRNLQGFDMFMYNSNSIKDAIYQYHGHNKYKRLPRFRLLSFQAHIERTQLILDQLLEEDIDDFLAVESKYEKVSCELYNKDIENPNDICELQEIP